MKAALVSGAEIELQNDIYLTKSVHIISVDDVVIYGNGFKLDGQNGVPCVIINGTKSKPASGIILNGLKITRGFGSRPEQGGGLSVEMAIVNVINCSIHDNHADFYGGGMHVGSGGKVTISSSSIIGNFAVRRGGGIRVHRGSLKLLYSQIYRNFAGGGGGLEFFEAQDSEVRGCAISDNNATNSGGGIAVYQNHNTLNIQGP